MPNNDAVERLRIERDRLRSELDFAIAIQRRTEIELLHAKAELAQLREHTGYRVVVQGGNGGSYE